MAAMAYTTPEAGVYLVSVTVFVNGGGQSGDIKLWLDINSLSAYTLEHRTFTTNDTKFTLHGIILLNLSANDVISPCVDLNGSGNVAEFEPGNMCVTKLRTII